MSIDHEAFAEANQPPPARVVQGAARSIAGEGATLVSVSRRREGDVLHVTTTWLAKGRADQITAHVDGGSVAFVRRLK